MCKGCKIEARAVVGLNKIGRGAGHLGQLSDLDLAILRKRADRHNPRLVTGAKRDDGFGDRAHLEHRAITGGNTDIEQCRGQNFRAAIKVREGDLLFAGNQIGLFRGYACSLAHNVPNTALEPRAVLKISVDLARVAIIHAMNGDPGSRPVHVASKAMRCLCAGIVIHAARLSMNSIGFLCDLDHPVDNRLRLASYIGNKRLQFFAAHKVISKPPTLCVGDEF